MSVRDDLIEGLNVLAKSWTMSNPTYQNVQKLAPHLDRDEASAMLLPPADGLRYFIGPPVIYRGAEHVYFIRTHPFPTTTGERQALGWSHCYRRKESYAHVTVPANWKLEEYDYRERVADFAEIHYGQHLHWDKTLWHAEFSLIDVLRTYFQGDEPTFFIDGECWAGFRYTLPAMQTAASEGFPLLDLVNHHMIDIARTRWAAGELLGTNLPTRIMNCSYCGGELNQLGCTFCRRRFLQEVPTPLAGIGLPIPLRVCLSGGWEERFQVHPLNASKKYYLDWASDLQTLTFDAIERDRIISLREP